MCFQGNGVQVRVSGVLEQVEDEALKAEIFAHPTRKFLQQWKELGVEHLLMVFRMRHGKAVTWTMETNFDEKKYIEL